MQSLLDPLVVGAKPTLDVLTAMPGGIILDQQERLLIQHGPVLAALGQKLHGDRTDELAVGQSQPHLLWRRGRRPQQQSIAGQRFRLQVTPGRGFLHPAHGLAPRGPAMQLRLGQSTPPDVIGNAERPRRMGFRTLDQPVASCFFLP